jgi:hypothetical protein
LQDRIDANDDSVGMVAFQDIAVVNDASSSNLESVEPLGTSELPPKQSISNRLQ